MKKTVLLVAIPILIAFLYIANLLITKRTENREVKRYNLEYEYYLNKIVYGTDLTTVINKAVNQNEINRVKKDEKNLYIDNGENSIKIDIKFNLNGKVYPMEALYDNDITNFVQNFNVVKFKCTHIEYHKSTGRVSKLVFEDIEE